MSRLVFFPGIVLGERFRAGGAAGAQDQAQSKREDRRYARFHRNCTATLIVNFPDPVAMAAIGQEVHRQQAYLPAASS